MKDVFGSGEGWSEQEQSGENPKEERVRLRFTHVICLAGREGTVKMRKKVIFTPKKQR